MATFHSGEYYRIVYKQQGGNYRWSYYEMTAQYIGSKKTHPTSETTHQFSLRPEAGTTELEHRNLDQVTHVINDLAVPKLPRKLRPEEVK